MPEMSEKYVDILIKIKGKNLDAKVVNPLIQRFDAELKDLKVKEQRSDGKTFIASVNLIDNRRHELLDKDTLILSRQVKWNIYNPYPHTFDNLEHKIHVCLHQAMMKIEVRKETGHGEEIVIKAIDSHVPGSMREGRWPRDAFDRAMI